MIRTGKSLMRIFFSPAGELGQPKPKEEKP